MNFSLIFPLIYSCVANPWVTRIHDRSQNGNVMLGRTTNPCQLGTPGFSVAECTQQFTDKKKTSMKIFEKVKNKSFHLKKLKK